MPRPKNIRDIVIPTVEKTTPATDPFFDGWAEQYGRHPWWRVEGFKFAMVKADVSFRDLASKEVRSNAVALAQTMPDWLDFYRLPSGLNDAAGGWGSIGDKALLNVLNGLPPQKQAPHSERSAAVTFPKAALAILCLEIAVDGAEDIYQWVRICPAIYNVAGFDESFWKGLSKKEKIAAGDECAIYGGWSCLQELATHSHRTVTYPMAEMISEHFWHQNSVGGPTIHPTPGAITRQRKPNRFERQRSRPRLRR